MAQAVTIAGFEVWHRQGGKYEPPTSPPCSGETSDRVTAAASPNQAVSFIQLYVQLFPKFPLSHTNCKRAWAS